VPPDRGPRERVTSARCAGTPGRRRSAPQGAFGGRLYPDRTTQD
jgi:hypothetical protein